MGSSKRKKAESKSKSKKSKAVVHEPLALVFNNSYGSTGVVSRDSLSKTAVVGGTCLAPDPIFTEEGEGLSQDDPNRGSAANKENEKKYSATIVLFGYDIEFLYNVAVYKEGEKRGQIIPAEDIDKSKALRAQRKDMLRSKKMEKDLADKQVADLDKTVLDLPSVFSFGDRDKNIPFLPPDDTTGLMTQDMTQASIPSSSMEGLEQRISPHSLFKTNIAPSEVSPGTSFSEINVGQLNIMGANTKENSPSHCTTIVLSPATSVRSVPQTSLIGNMKRHSANISSSLLSETPRPNNSQFQGNRMDSLPQTSSGSFGSKRASTGSDFVPRLRRNIVPGNSAFEDSPHSSCLQVEDSCPMSALLKKATPTNLAFLGEFMELAQRHIAQAATSTSMSTNEGSTDRIKILAAGAETSATSTNSAQLASQRGNKEVSSKVARIHSTSRPTVTAEIQQTPRQGGNREVNQEAMADVLECYKHDETPKHPLVDNIPIYLTKMEIMSIPGVVPKPPGALPKERKCKLVGFENCLYPRQMTNYLLKLLVPQDKCTWEQREDIPANIYLAVKSYINYRLPAAHKMMDADYHEFLSDYIRGLRRARRDTPNQT